LESSSSSATGSVPALRRAVRILDFVGSTDSPPNAAEIARALGLPKSTAHGLISAMVDLDLLSRLPGGTFRMGPQLMRWTSDFLGQFDLVEEFQRYFTQRDDFRSYSVTLTTLEDRDVVYLACRNSDAPLGFTFRIGMRLPAVFTATGKVMLSSRTDAELMRLYGDEWPEPLTRRGTSSLVAFLAEAEQIRSRGYSVDDGQVREGMVCVGASVCDFSGKPVAGIAISLLEQEARPDAIEQLGMRLRSVARDLSGRLGSSHRSQIQLATAEVPG
jgi:DNA-binding IclR family transcriptional regulator